MKYTEKKAAALCNRLLKAARKAHCERIQTAWTDAQGRTCVCDGYRAYRLNDCPADISEFGPCFFDLDKTAFALLDAGDVVEMPAPDYDAVKAFLKGKDNAAFDLGPEFPLMNPAYLKEALELFPDGKWYVDADPLARMIHPVYIVSKHGSACVLPIRTAAKPYKKPEEQPAPADPVPAPEPAPAPAPADHSSPRESVYFVYSRPAGEKRFLLTDIGRGAVGLKKVFAPVYRQEHFERLQTELDHLAAVNPGAAFQIRTIRKGRTVYTAVPTFTPEEFAQRCAV